MSNNVVRARLVLIWCMSVATVGAWRVVTGSELTLLGVALLAATGILPPVVMLLTWRKPVSVAAAITAPSV